MRPARPQAWGPAGPLPGGAVRRWPQVVWLREPCRHWRGCLGGGGRDRGGAGSDLHTRGGGCAGGLLTRSGCWRCGRDGGFGRGVVLGQFVELGQIALQLIEAVALIFGLLLDGHLFFGGRALDGALGQGQLVRRGRGGAGILDVGLDLATGAAVGCLYGRLRGLGGQAAAVGVEVTALRGDDLACLAGGGLQRLFAAGHLHHGSGADAVDVAVDERLGVAAQHGHQHLVQRHAVGAVGIRQAPGRVAGLHPLAVVAGLRCRRRCGGRGGCGGTWAWGGAGRCGRRSGHGGRHLGGRGRRGRAALAGWGVQQQGVGAHQIAGAPLRVDHQVDKRLIDRGVAAQAQAGRAIGVALQADLHTAGGAAVVHTLGTEDLGGGDLHAQAVDFRRGDLRDRDLRAQVFTQRRLDADGTQRQGCGIGGGKGHRNKGRGGQG